MKIRYQITLIMALVMLIPVYLVNFFYFRDNIRQHHHETDIAMQAVNQQLQHDIDTFLESTLNTVRGDSLGPSLREYLEADAAKRREKQATLQERMIGFALKDSVNINSVALIDASGMNLVDSMPDQAHHSEKAAAYFQSVMKEDRPLMVGPVREAATPNGALYFVSPIRNGKDQLIGALRIRMEQSRLQQIIHRLTLDEELHAYAMISDASGRILAHSETPALIGTQLPPLTRQKIDASEDPDTRTGWIRLTNKNGATESHRIITDYQREMPWRVHTAQPSRLYYAREHWQWLVWGLEQAGITLLILLASYIAGRRISTPITRLNEDVNLALQQHTSIREPKNATTEVSDLTHAFVTLTGTLEKSLQTLGESEQHFRSLVTQVPGIVFRARSDTKGTLLYVSPAAQNIIGHSPEELCGEYGIGAMKLIHPGDQAVVARSLDAAVLSRCGIDLECRMQHRNGSIIWVHFKATVNADQQNEPLIEGLVLDISERKLAEQALITSEERYQKLVETAPEAIIVLDIEQGSFVDANLRALKLFGYSRDEFMTLAGPGAISPERQPDGSDSMQAALHYLGEAIAGKIPSFEWTHRNKAGQSFPCEVHLSRMPDRDHILIRGSIVDISARKAAEKALKDSQEQLRLVYDNTSDLIALYRVSANLEFTLESVNKAWLLTAASRNIHVTLEDLVGLPLEDLLTGPLGMPPEEVYLVTSRFKRCAQNLEHLDFEDSHTIGDQPFWIESHHTPVADESGNCAWVLYTARDISERRAAEEKIWRMNQELELRVAARTAELKSTNEELRKATEHLIQSEKLASLGSVVAGVAHELNTPIGNTLTVASTLQVKTRDFRHRLDKGSLLKSELLSYMENCEESATLLERNSRRASELIGNFKQVAVDQTSARRRQFDLHQTIQEVLSTLYPQLRHQSHRININIPDNIIMDSFPGPLEQVLTNLINNSIVHGFEDGQAGEITLTAGEAGDYVNVVYADNGVGIPEHLTKRVFDPFFTTKMGKGGSGLGLYLVYNLVTGLLGGTIRIESQPGAGTRIEMSFPKRAPAMATGST